MGFTGWGKLRFWENTEAADIVGASVALANSGDANVLGKFATQSDRNAALAALAVGDRPGVVAFVTADNGWSGYNGSAWVPDLARRVAYAQSKSFASVSPGVNVYFANMPTSNGFVGDATGVTVPEDGVYVATLTASTAAPINPNRWYVELGAAGTVSRSTLHATLSNEDRISVTFAGAQMGAGNSLICQFGHNNATAVTISAYLTIAKVAS